MSLLIKTANTGNFLLFRQSNPSPLVGGREGDSFKLHRFIEYRNSFKPIAFGRISSHQGNTIIEIFVSMHWFTIIFTFFWLLGVGLAFFALLLSSDYATILIPLGMFVFAFLLMYFGFWLGTPKLKKLISSILKDD